MKAEIVSPYQLEIPKGIPTLTGPYGRATYPKGYTSLVLLHNDWDLLFAAKGKVVWKLKSGERLVTPEGWFWLKPPSVPVVLESPSSAMEHWFCHFEFRPVPDRVFPSVQRDCLDREQKIFVPAIFSKAEAPGVWQAYRKLLSLNLNTDRHPWKVERALIQLVSTLADLGMKLGLQETENTFLNAQAIQDPRVVNLCQRIIANPSHRWSCVGLARESGLSCGYLNRLFHSNVGRGLKDYIIQTRLQQALISLRVNGEQKIKSIKEISSACGFSNQHLFSRQFKAVYGIGPLKYRRQSFSFGHIGRR